MIHRVFKSFEFFDIPNFPIFRKCLDTWILEFFKSQIDIKLLDFFIEQFWNHSKITPPGLELKNMQWQDHHGKLTNQIQVQIWLERQQQLWQQHLLLGCSSYFEGSQVKKEQSQKHESEQKFEVNTLKSLYPGWTHRESNRGTDSCSRII